MNPCNHCGSTKSRRTESDLYYDVVTVCLGAKACARRTKKNFEKKILEACARGDHSMFVNGQCVDCGRPQTNNEVQSEV